VFEIKGTVFVPKNEEMHLIVLHRIAQLQIRKELLAEVCKLTNQENSEMEYKLLLSLDEPFNAILEQVYRQFVPDLPIFYMQSY